MLRFALQRVLGGDACLQLGGGRSLGRGELLGGVPAALLRREARGELGGGTRLRVLEAARRSGRLLVRRRLGGCRLLGGEALLRRALERRLGRRALARTVLGLAISLRTRLGRFARRLLRN